MKTSTKVTAESVEEIQAATHALGEIQKTMTFLISLTPAERLEHRSKKVGPASLRLLENRVAAARQHRDLLPPAFDLRRFERDTQLTRALQECLSRVNAIRTGLNDTLLAVGSRAVQAGVVVYGHIKVSAGPAKELQWTVDKLARRTGRARPATATEPASPAAPAAEPAPVNPADRKVA